MTQSTSTMALVTLLLAGLSGQPAGACGYDGLYANPLQAAYPGSISLAVASRTAVEQRLIPALAPLSGSSGLFRSQVWLRTLRGKLETQGFSGSVALLLVDSGLWSRYHTLPPEQQKPPGNGVQLEPHVSGPDAEEWIVMTTEAALSALLAGQIDIDTARQAGLIRYQRTDAIPAMERALRRGKPVTHSSAQPA